MKIDNRDRFQPMNGQESRGHLDFERLGGMTDGRDLDDPRSQDGHPTDSRSPLTWQRIGWALADWVRGLLRRSRIRRAVRELQALDDRTLKDIGLTRGQIHSAACEAESLIVSRRNGVRRKSGSNLSR